MDWLKGKKVYFISASAILAAFAGFLDDQITFIQMLEAAWIAILAMAGRAAISKVGK